MNSELIKFLRARLDEDEAVARTASPGPWHANEESDEVLAVDGITVADGFALSSHQLRATIEHIARHDPVRVLREVAAKWAIVEVHGGTAGESSMFCPHCEHDTPCPTLRLLASVYADHPDYRQEWMP